MMNAPIHGPKLWNRSVYFELRVKDQPDKVFSLPFPPETFRVRQPQRVNRTKTFGGVFEDDSGLDNQTISISGSVGGTDQWEYLDSGDVKTTMSASILFRIFDQIIQYKKYVKLADLADYSLRVYFLWMAPSSYLTGHALVTDQLREDDKVLSFDCSLDDFEFSQDQNAPLRWAYKLDLFAFRQLGTFNPKTDEPPPTQPSIGDMIASLQTKVNNFKAGVIGFTGGINQAVATYAGYVTQAADLMTAIATMPMFLESQALGVAQNAVQQTTLAIGALGGVGASILNAQANVIGQVNNLGGAIRALYNLPGTIAAGAKVAMQNVQDQLTALRSSYDFTAKTSDPFVAAGLQASNSPAVVRDGTTHMGRYLSGVGRPPASQMYSALISGANLDLLSDHNAWIEGMLRMQMPPMVLSSDSGTPAITAYGVTTVPIQSGDSLETVSLRYLGNVGYGYLIAMLNGVTALDGMSVGSMVTIPVTSQSPQMAANRVYGPDPLGVDIALDPSSQDFTASANGDLRTVGGEQNLAQAMNNRLNTVSGTFLRNLAYGIKIDPNAITSIMAANIKDTIIQDPRIVSVDNLFLKGNLNALEVTAEVQYSLGRKARLAGAVNG